MKSRIMARAFKATAYLANRATEGELPCWRCQGEGILMPKTVHGVERDCPFCAGMGVAPGSYGRAEDGSFPGQ